AEERLVGDRSGLSTRRGAQVGGRSRRCRRAVTLLAVVELLCLAAFAGLAGASYAQWHRRRGEPAAWLTLTFSILAVVTVTAAIVGPVTPDESGSVPVRTMVALLALFPYCLYRFTTSFRPVS